MNLRISRVRSERVLGIGHRVLIYSFGLPLLCIGYALGQGQNYQPAAEDYGCSQAQKYDEF